MYLKIHCKLQNSIKIVKKQGNTLQVLNFIFSLLCHYPYKKELKMSIFLFIFLALVKLQIRNKQKD